jgi:hypothetical protein
LLALLLFALLLLALLVLMLLPFAQLLLLLLLLLLALLQQHREELVLLLLLHTERLPLLASPACGIFLALEEDPALLRCSRGRRLSQGGQAGPLGRSLALSTCGCVGVGHLAVMHRAPLRFGEAVALRCFRCCAVGLFGQELTFACGVDRGGAGLFEQLLLGCCVR